VPLPTAASAPRRRDGVRCSPQVSTTRASGEARRTGRRDQRAAPA
jgi:hypothetical protein